MRIIMLDLDTLRPDHLGCYGYSRDTSPNIDRVASEGVRLDNCYVSDAPCLPARSALVTGRFGIHNGVVNHGGVNADPAQEGAARQFKQKLDRESFFGLFRRAKLYTASVSPFGERHSAWQFYAGLNEIYNPAGRSGQERADEIAPTALDWLDRNRQRDNWFLHVNFWDPHTPYRTPADYGNPFENEAPPDWLTQETLDRHRADGFGPMGAADVIGYCYKASAGKYPRLPADLATVDDFARWIDGYDCGIRYMDDAIGRILAKLEEQGLLEETAILITSDHGENQGELNVYGDHQTADHITSRVPLIIRWPGVTTPGASDGGPHYQLDLLPTLAEMLKVAPADSWDGTSFAAALREPGSEPAKATARNYLVVSQMAWSCQRAVRWDNWILIRTYHAGLKNYPPVMLFDLAADPHEQHDLAAEQPDAVAIGLALLEQWHAEQMATSPSPVDPLQTILREGGPYHAREVAAGYLAHLKSTGRGELAERLRGEMGVS